MLAPEPWNTYASLIWLLQVITPIILQALQECLFYNSRCAIEAALLSVCVFCSSHVSCPFQFVCNRSSSCHQPCRGSNTYLICCVCVCVFDLHDCWHYVVYYALISNVIFTLFCRVVFPDCSTWVVLKFVLINCKFQSSLRGKSPK